MINIKKIFLGKTYKKVLEIITEVESMALNTGLQPIDIYVQLLPNIKKQKKIYKELSIVVNKIKNHTNPILVYKKYLDENVYSLFYEASNKSIPLGKMFNYYAKISSYRNKAESKLKGTLTKPLVMYFVTSGIAIYALHKIGHLMAQNNISGSGTVDLIKDGIIISLVLIPALLITMLTKFPHKMPILKNVYNLIYSYYYLSVTNLMFDNGFSIIDVERFFSKIMKKVKTKAKPTGSGAYFSEIMSKYVTPVEITLINVAMSKEQIKEALPRIIFNKETEFLEKVQLISDMLSELLILINIIPIMSLVGGISVLLINVMSQL